MSAKPEVAYRNLGVGLLGQALADRAGAPYEALVREQITGPLGMRETVIRFPLRCGHGWRQATTRTTSRRTPGT